MGANMPVLAQRGLQIGSSVDDLQPIEALLGEDPRFPGTPWSHPVGVPSYPLLPGGKRGPIENADPTRCAWHWPFLTLKQLNNLLALIPQGQDSARVVLVTAESRDDWGLYEGTLTVDPGHQLPHSSGGLRHDVVANFADLQPALLLPRRG